MAPDARISAEPRAVVLLALKDGCHHRNRGITMFTPRGFPVPPWGVVAENSDRLRPIRKEIAERGLHFLCQRACL